MCLGITQIYLKEIVRDDVKWINPARDSDRRRFLMRVVTNYRVTYNAENFILTEEFLACHEESYLHV